MVAMTKKNTSSDADAIEFDAKWKNILSFEQPRRRYSLARVGEHRLAIVGGSIEDGRSLNNIDVFDLDDGGWSHFYMTVPRENGAAVAMGHRLFILGGFDGTDRLDTCEVIDVSRRSAAPRPLLPRLPEKRHGCAAVAFQERYLVVLGGYTGESYLSSVLMMDMGAIESDDDDSSNHNNNNNNNEAIKGRWIPLPPMRQERAAFAATVVGPFLIVAGGYNGSFLSSVELLDMRNLDQWISLPNMKAPRHMCGAVALERPTHIHNSKPTKTKSFTGSFVLLVAGGPDTKTVDMFDTHEGKWETLAAHRSTSRACRLELVNEDHLIAAGGSRIQSLRFATPHALTDERFLQRLFHLPTIIITPTSEQKTTTTTTTTTTSIMQELSVIGRRLRHLAQLQLYYTMVHVMLRLRVLSHPEASRLVVEAFERILPFCSSVEQVHYFLGVLRHAQAKPPHGLIDEQQRLALGAKLATVTTNHASAETDLLHTFQAFVQTDMKTFRVLHDGNSRSCPATDGHREELRYQSNLMSYCCCHNEGTAIKVSGNLPTRTCIEAGVGFVAFVLHILSHEEENNFEARHSMTALLPHIADLSDVNHLRQEALQSSQAVQCAFEEGLRIVEGRDFQKLFAAIEDDYVPMLMGAAVGFFSRLSQAIADYSDAKSLEQQQARERPKPEMPTEMSTETDRSKENYHNQKQQQHDRSASKSSIHEASNSIVQKLCSGPEYRPILGFNDHNNDLFAAIFCGSIDLYNEIMTDDPNIDVNKLDSMGRTPADFAAIMGEVEILNDLVQRGAIFKLQSNSIMSALASFRSSTDH